MGRRAHQLNVRMQAACFSSCGVVSLHSADQVRMVLCVVHTARPRPAYGQRHGMSVTIQDHMHVSSE